MKIVSSLFFLLFGLFWCGTIAVIDSMALPVFFRQLRAVDFPTATGFVTASTIKEGRGSKGKRTYKPEVAYRYTVNGQDFASNRLSYGAGSFGNGDRYARRVTGELPVGKEVAVRYDPAAPGEAVLRPGLLPEHLLIALFVTPHHLIGLGLLFAGIGAVGRGIAGRNKRSPLRPQDDLRASVRMPRTAPWLIGMLTLGFGSFASIFLVVLLVPLPPPMPLMIGLWAVLLGGAVSLALRRRWQLASGAADLTIDAGAKTVTLPLGYGRKQRVTFDFADVQGLSVAARTRRVGSRGRSTKIEHELGLVGPNEEIFPLGMSSQRDEIQAIAEALQNAFGWPVRRG